MYKRCSRTAAAADAGLGASDWLRKARARTEESGRTPPGLRRVIRRGAGLRRSDWAWGARAQEKEEAANTSKRAARRSAACAAGGGDADGDAESDDDDDAESDDVRMRLAKLEAMEHGELDWDDDDVYGLGRGQSWSSVDHLA